VYPVEDDLGEEMIQRRICEELRPQVEEWLASRGVIAFVGADQFVYFRQYDPSAVVSPDVYVMPGADPSASPRAWKLWEGGAVPSFALEVVADDRRKDYERAPSRYAELGVGELFVFDPRSREGRDRVRWQVYRRDARRGLAQALVTDADRVRSRALGCFLREIGEGGSLRIRLATGARGESLVPTAAERAARAADAERAAREAADAERAAREAAEATARVERAAREAAEATARADRAARERAEAELARLRAARPRRRR
jgi:hypothetical protein